MIYWLKEANHLSEPTLISPLLDGFTVGLPMSSHSGVSCFPAIQESTEKKYIVKKISVPASQVQMEALLLTGACKDPAQALDYFREQADEIAAEAAFLEKMARLEGFLPYDGVQVAPMKKNRLGYDVYLVGTYKRSLEKFMKRHAMTHLEAVNLGLDLCAALNACRRAGYLYVDLKPSNVFLSGAKEYRIGDLGFAPIGSLKYTSLPEKYYSPYSAPEIRDSMNTLNETADTYSVGMILYEIYNGGTLPTFAKGESTLPPPAFADEKMAEIICKACASSPEDRWQTAEQMGQALVAYMQSSTVNDTPIAEPVFSTGTPVGAAAEESPDLSKTVHFPIPDLHTAETQETDLSQTQMYIPISEVAAPIAEEPGQELPEPEAELEAEPEIEITTEPTLSVVPETVIEENQEFSDIDNALINVPDSGVVQTSAVDSYTEPVSDYMAAEPVTDCEDTAVAVLDIPTVLPKEVTEEVTPDTLEDSEESSFENELQEVNALLSANTPKKKRTLPNSSPAPATIPVVYKNKRSGAGGLIVVLLILVAIALGLCSYEFYQLFYLQTVDSIFIEGSQTEMTVHVKTSADNSLLTVVSTDVFGHNQEKPLVNGSAVFTDLSPASLYKVHLEVSGLHKLVGQVSDIYTTESETKIVDFSGVTGAEEGTVLISLTVDGYEPDEWTAICSAEGEDDIVVRFSGHSATIRGLTVGKDYTIRLTSAENTPLTGQDRFKFSPSSLILATNLNVTSITNGEMHVRWDQPVETTIENWKVRCYGDGYDETQSVSELSAVFNGIDGGKAYTVEVTAEGMTQPARTNVTANPITVKTWDIDESKTDSLVVKWDIEGAMPDEGWLLMYSIDGGQASNIMQCTSNFATISPRIPGATYEFAVQSPDGTSIFDNSFTYNCPKAELFLGYGISNYIIKPNLLPTPENANWNYMNISNSEFTTVFTPRKSISMVLQVNSTFYLTRETIPVLHVVRDSDGKIVENLFVQNLVDWHDLWADYDYHFCELNGTTAPSTAGSYTYELYFNGMLAASIPFTVEG